MTIKKELNNVKDKKDFEVFKNFISMSIDVKSIESLLNVNRTYDFETTENLMICDLYSKCPITTGKTDECKKEMEEKQKEEK